MSNDNRRSTGKDKRYNHGHAETAFCEELLHCLICDKIYFSRRPIKLPTLQRRSLHVCSPCSEVMICSMCGKHVTLETALFIENLPDSGGGLLCPRCRDKLFLSFRAEPKGIGKAMGTAVTSVFVAVSSFFRRILSIRIHRGGKTG
jgi:DNA-directed RNA polymerase subunit RPC12/RpoP